MTKRIEQWIGWLLHGTMAAMLAGVALGAGAQGVQPLAGLKWQPMHTINFNSNANYPSIGATAEEIALMRKIWARELAASPKMDNGFPVISTVIASTIEYQGKLLAFSIYDRQGYVCEEPPNDVTPWIFFRFVRYGLP